MTRSALIFGISGQDGSYLAELLLEKGYRVAGVTRDPHETRRKLANLEMAQVDLFAADMRQLDAIEAVIKASSPDEIYNFSGFSTGSGMYDDPIAMVDLNGLSVVRILQAIRASGRPIRFCQASSSEMFGNPPASPQTEATPFSPRSPYGAAKLLAHNAIRIYRQRFDVFACSAILFNHESPRRSEAFVTRKISRAAAAISCGKLDRLVLGDLTARRDWGYAADYARSMWLMLQAEAGDDYVVATGKTHSVAELCDIAFGHLGLNWRDHVETRPDPTRAPDGVQLVGDARRARERLGWAPSITFEKLIQTMVDHDLADLRDAA